jgi:glycosyltransferase involved in cell wall biosynthesis
LTDSRLRVLALSPIPIEGAGCRFRIAQFVPYLRDHGIDVTISPFYSQEYFEFVYRPGHFVRKVLGAVPLLLKRWRELPAFKEYDLVFLYREAVPAGPPVIERSLARHVPILYDFDDAIFLPNVSEANQRISFLKTPERIAELLRLSALVVAGNQFLAAYARQHNKAVEVIPTAVDTDYFVPRRDPAQSNGRDLVVGWIGSPTTFQYLKTLAPVLSGVSAEHPFTLRVSGAGTAVDFPGLRVETPAWSLADEVRLFNTLDIGVYPLNDDDWARGKCGFKAIQCMACGVPVVAQAVGVNREIIRDGENGFLALTPAEWHDKLGRLLTDSRLRARFAREGRKTIEQSYSLRVVAPRLAAAMRTASGAGRAAGPA